VHASDLVVIAAPRALLRGSGIPWARLFVGGALGTGGVQGLAPVWGGELRGQVEPHVSWRPWFFAATAGYRQGRAKGPVAFIQRELELTAGVGAAIYLFQVRAFAALELGGALISQEQLPDEPDRRSLAAALGASAGVEVPVYGPWSAFVSASGGPWLVRRTGGLDVTWNGRALIGMGLSL
jgi:hypothetical protein